jgi:hypothetical protein
MGKGLIIAVALIAIIGVGAYVGLLNIGIGQPPTDTMVVAFSAVDKLLGSQDAATTAVILYRMVDGALVTQETVTMNAASVSSTLYYTTGELLYLKLYDATDTSLCTQYLQWTVPSASPADIQASKFHCTLWTTDKGDTSKSLTVTASNGTAVSVTTDCSASSYNTNYANWELKARALNDDSGYVNTYNFVNGYKNNHYMVVQVSGTGWDRVRFVNAYDSFERNNIHYIVIVLDDNAVTRDKQSDGSYNPTGIVSKDLTLDLTAITTSDDVSLVFSYRWYADWDYFKTSGNWGVNSAQTAATTIHIYP